MPHKDVRTESTSGKGKYKTSGRRVVAYRNAKGFTQQATVLSEGTSSGLKIAVGSEMGRVVDNVPLATARTQTNVYIARA